MCVMIRPHNTCIAPEGVFGYCYTPHTMLCHAAQAPGYVNMEYVNNASSGFPLDTTRP